MKRGRCFADGDHCAIVACDGTEVLVGRVVAPGTSIPPGGRLVRVATVGDCHIDYETVYDAPPVDYAGPPQIATDAYRDGWEQTFKEVN